MLSPNRHTNPKRLPLFRNIIFHFLLLLLPTAGFKSRNWRSKSNPVAGSSTAGRFDSCFPFSLAKGNDDSRKRIHDSSSDD